MRNYLLAGTLLFSFFVGLGWGTEGWFSPLDLFTKDSIAFSHMVLVKLRLPRVLLAFLSGGALGVCGLIFQALFRNDLASPYTLGVASGAAFGASFSLFLQGIIGATLLPSTSLFAFSGAMGTVFFILLVSKLKKSFYPATLILSGVVASFFFSSLIVLIHYFAKSESAKKMVQWTLGDLSIVGFEGVLWLLPWIVLGMGYFFYRRMELNLLGVGEVFATSRGLDVLRFRKQLFVITSIILGIVISVTGPIAFVGLVCPHIVKRFWGLHFSKNLIPCFFFSGIFLIWCDLVSRIGMAGLIFPVGIMTSLIGAPFFFWVLLKKSA